MIILDGAMGTELYKRGYTGDTALANVSAFSHVAEIHRAYLEAGSTVLTANTFSAYPHKHKNFAELINKGIEAARTAGGNRVFHNLGPTGLILEPYGDSTDDELFEIFSQAAAAGADADGYLIETMMDLRELEIAVRAAAQFNKPIYATMTFNENGKTMYGNSIKDLCDALKDTGAVIGMNCGFGPEAYLPLVDEMALYAESIILQPNAGLPVVLSDGTTEYTLGPADFAQIMLRAKDKADILGGCCGTTPEHIRAMVELCK